MREMDMLTREETVQFLDWVSRHCDEENPDPLAKVLVRGAPYQLHGMHWAAVERIMQGDAAPYPIRVRFHDGRRGQYSIGQLLAASPTRAALAHPNRPEWLDQEAVIR